MNLSELQAFLEESTWDDVLASGTAPAENVSEGELPSTRDEAESPVDLTSEDAPETAVPPTLRAEDDIRLPVPPVDLEPEPVFASLAMPRAASSSVNPTRQSPPVKLVPKLTDVVEAEPPLDRSTLTLQERLKEVEMAQRMGYLLCKCTWPPQIMVLTGTDHVYRCRRCSRVREM